MSDSLLEFFTQDHRACDAGWAGVEQALNAGQDASAAWKAFDEHMRRHLGMEEDVVFPAFEAASGMTGGIGPTAVMRHEHGQMRGLLDQIGEAVAAGNSEEALDQGDTLMMLIQQHNMKEEGMLYPMATRILAAEWPALQEQLASYS